ncbi:hypothetical protein E2562_008959 [Oryza meyeriana var. granulata]|uniref:Uncharacterized protein n=1 Tax=Oryza meyeriana var. granulata TaxID=110450 RepID=A0A6G1D0H4_9ORYZ|nr:hypothetical protein E2562_008959 [Oryza meyeriana var. granulata]
MLKNLGQEDSTVAADELVERSPLVEEENPAPDELFPFDDELAAAGSLQQTARLGEDEEYVGTGILRSIGTWQRRAGATGDQRQLREGWRRVGAASGGRGRGRSDAFGLGRDGSAGPGHGSGGDGRERPAAVTGGADPSPPGTGEAATMAPARGGRPTSTATCRLLAAHDDGGGGGF